MRHILSSKIVIFLLVIIIVMGGIIIKNCTTILKYEEEEAIQYSTYVHNYRAEFRLTDSLIQKYNIDDFDNSGEKVIILTELIECMTKSNMYYQIAEYMKYKNNNYGFNYKLLIENYISVIKGYMGYLQSDSIDPYNYDMKDILKDIVYISEWLGDFKNNKDDIHSDDDFYSEVFPNLNERIQANASFSTFE